MRSRPTSTHVHVLSVVCHVGALVELLVLRVLDDLLLELVLGELELVLSKVDVDEVFTHGHLVRRDRPLQLASDEDEAVVQVLGLRVAWLCS